MNSDTFWSVLRGNWHSYFERPWLVSVFAAVVVLAFLPGAPRALRKVDRALAWASRRAWRGPLVVGLFALVWGAFPSLVGRTLPPAVHDEVSYLLAADTFLHGRLSNPTPPMWKSFQTMHELMQPTYASKFPPGQGLALAAGSLLGSPRIGAFGMIALASAGVCWMLRAVLPARWAVAGGLLAALHPTAHEWGQTFWGGGVAMFGATLLCGGALRVAPYLKASPRRSRFHAPNRSEPSIPVGCGIVMGVGIAILLNSRPFEGTLLCLIVGTWLLVRAIRAGIVPALLLRTTLPAAITLAPVLAWMGYYNYRVTGDPLLMPYAEHARQYMSAPIFWWQSASLRELGIDRLDGFHLVFEVTEWKSQCSLYGFLVGLERKLLFITRDAMAPTALLIVTLVGGTLAIRRRRRPALLAAACCAALLVLHVSMTPWLRTQYLAVVAPAFLLFVMAAVREVRSFHPRRAGALGTATLLGLVLVLGASSVIRFWQATANRNTSPLSRERMVQDVVSRRGKHIVFVNYESGQQRLYEWVHNSADIAGQQVIFTRFLEHEQNRQVYRSFPGRSLWLLSVGYNSYRNDLKIYVDPDHPERPPVVIPE